MRCFQLAVPCLVVAMMASTGVAVAQTDAIKPSVYVPASIQPKMPAALALMSVGSDVKTSTQVGYAMSGTLQFVSFGPDPNRAPIFELAVVDAQVNQAASRISVGAFTMVLEDVVPSFVSMTVPPRPGSGPAANTDQGAAVAKMEADLDAAEKAVKAALPRFGRAQCTVYGADSDKVPLVRCENGDGQVLAKVLVDAGLARPRVSTPRRLMP